MKQQNEVKEKEVKLLKEQNKQKDEIIHDLDKYYKKFGSIFEFVL